MNCLTASFRYNGETLRVTRMIRVVEGHLVIASTRMSTSRLRKNKVFWVSSISRRGVYEDMLNGRCVDLTRLSSFVGEPTDNTKMMRSIMTSFTLEEKAYKNTPPVLSAIRHYKELVAVKDIIMRTPSLISSID